MLRKPLPAAILLFAGLSAAAPKIEQARVDSMVRQLNRQSGLPADAPVPEEARKQVETELQATEVLKNAALRAALNEEADVKLQLKNAEARFYADRYTDYLMEAAPVSELDLHRAYDFSTRLVGLQQIRFDTEAEARQAQQLLLKGLDFGQLASRYPGRQVLREKMALKDMPPAVAQVVATMERGEISRRPVRLDGGYYLIKVATAERAAGAPPPAQIRPQLVQAVKRQKAEEKIRHLLQANGVIAD
ncbi:MAG: peptidyl-prolyl cis-trans isomerase [Neisseria sp.]|nr:peptidyl-prolyl cis-trans isomerase [Neisseria sp.]